MELSGVDDQLMVVSSTSLPKTTNTPFTSKSFNPSTFEENYSSSLPTALKTPMSADQVQRSRRLRMAEKENGDARNVYETPPTYYSATKHTPRVCSSASKLSAIVVSFAPSATEAIAAPLESPRDDPQQLKEENARLKSTLKLLKETLGRASVRLDNQAELLETTRRALYSVTSANDGSLQNLVTTPKTRSQPGAQINIVVDSFTKKELSHVDFNIRVTFGSGNSTGFVIQRRFTEIRALHRRVLDVAQQAARPTSAFYPLLGSAPDELHTLTLQRLQSDVVFPACGLSSNWKRFDDDFLQTRLASLQLFFNQLISTAKRAGRGSPVRRVLSNWLELDAADDEIVWRDDRVLPLPQSFVENRNASFAAAEALNVMQRSDSERKPQRTES